MGVVYRPYVNMDDCSEQEAVCSQNYPSYRVAIISLGTADEEEMTGAFTPQFPRSCTNNHGLPGEDKKLSSSYSCLMLVLLVHDDDQSLVAYASAGKSSYRLPSTVRGYEASALMYTDTTTLALIRKGEFQSRL